jgi:hypothetical protein
VKTQNLDPLGPSRLPFVLKSQQNKFNAYSTLLQTWSRWRDGSPMKFRNILKKTMTSKCTSTKTPAVQNSCLKWISVTKITTWSTLSKTAKTMTRRLRKSCSILKSFGTPSILSMSTLTPLEYTISKRSGPSCFKDSKRLSKARSLVILFRQKSKNSTS